MKVMFLNSDFINALEANNVDLTSLVANDTFDKCFTHRDREVIYTESALVVQHLLKRQLNVDKCVLEPFTDIWMNGDRVDSYTNAVLANLTEEERIFHLDVIKGDVDNFCCIMADPNTAILYASPSHSDKGRKTLEAIFCAMALIMSPDAVMKYDLYEQFVQSL